MEQSPKETDTSYGLKPPNSRPKKNLNTSERSTPVEKTNGHANVYLKTKIKAAENPRRLDARGQVKWVMHKPQPQATAYQEMGDGTRTNDRWGPEPKATEQEPPAAQEKDDETETDGRYRLEPQVTKQ